MEKIRIKVRDMVELRLYGNNNNKKITDLMKKYGIDKEKLRKINRSLEAGKWKLDF